MDIHPVFTAITKSPTATGAQEAAHDQAPTSDGLAPTLYAPSTSVPQLPPIVHLIHGRLGREKVYTVISPDYNTPCIILVDMHWYSSSFTVKMLNGDSLTTGVFATARGKVGTYFGQNFLEVTLPSPLPTQTSGTKISMKCRMSPFQRHFINLDLVVEGDEHCLEWKKTTDAEAKALREAFYRKLVRRSGPKSSTGNSSMLPQAGFKNDGEEIVAFMADNSRWKPGHSFTVHFKASGLEGTLGEN
ncbi:hypothetical protein CGRA01v4_04199 [Colletotrichum graminicola]|uniref:Uncharacterized protein n=1 Tax=Colletotrichum graminicola (strain M1.001 / M2 / FGSC 10212) TaxID=645133 RepID=E3QVJ8_COLGM|nr:uncharacterized protein GLRG_10030 [Colletotrichum graminicola M1.001]EFQ34886.1 hypothetical protein GLRG_10030 [Colletotrichum graminicola M1.001]WDK12918.1 hypothetical protein CGRA01v4_04199 [Colletotrichum graminicola]